MIRSKGSRIIPLLSATLLTIMPVYQAEAGPGALPSTPLFLSTQVEPNIYFTLDDSGSMDFGPMIRTESGLGTYNGVPVVNGHLRAYYTPTFDHLYKSYWGYYVLPPSNGSSDAWDEAWVVRNHLANSNYYNPNLTYQPWPGTRADGTPLFVDADPTRALERPELPAGESVDLTVNHSFSEGGLTVNNFWIPTYHVWTDSDGDGVVEVSDANTRVEIAPGTDEMQNFANWFQYYRSRAQVTKNVVGGAINSTDASRMGMSWFNAGHTYDLTSMNDAVNKRNLQQILYDFQISTNGTPSRQALKDAGDYFMNSSNGPILPAAQGGECQQNYNIVITDGFWNGANPSVGNTDIDGGPSNTAFDGNASQSNDGGNYADNDSNTLADVAMRNYETDLRTDLADRVPAQPAIDEAEHQHLVTYTVGFGINGTLDPATDNPLGNGFAWPSPSANANTTADDLWHAAYNGRGQYLSAQSPMELQQAVSNAVTDISRRTGIAAAVAVNSAQLSTESVVYLAEFNSNRWHGNLLAYPIVDTYTGELAATPSWDAASKLDSRNLVSRPRNIITYDGSPSARDGAPFRWNDISVAMQDDLRTNALGGVDLDTVARARLDYLRGDRTHEGGGYFFRERRSLLGDIVNSGPVFVGEPNLSWPDYAPFPVDAAAYSKFKNGPARARESMVYVGANDGMLHAFNVETGDEEFAYAPGLFNSTAIGDGLHYLTEPNYAHRFYVDQTPTLSDVYLSSGGGTRWHTVLIGGLRSGGRGLFALNVTDPGLFSSESNADQIVMWEFSNADDLDLGYSFSRPFIALANNGRWVAIFGNGYNDLGSGEASLYIVDIEAGVDGNWTSGDYRKITTGVGDTADRNGLTTPAIVDIDGNGTVDRVYAGDLHGNMWAFDLSGATANSWDVAYSAGSTPVPLFNAPAGQAITGKPVVARHPTVPYSTSPSNSPNLMVFFGTGQYLVDSDKASTGIQSYYGVWDEGSKGLTRADLIEQTFDTSFTGKVLTRNPVDYSIDYGWYFDFDETGERSVTASIARADTVFFNSFIPVEDPCSVGGYGYKYAVDMETGGSPLAPTYDANNDGVVNEFDLVSNGIITGTLAAIRQEGYLPQPVFLEDLAITGEEATKIKGLKNVPVGRFAWQELLQ
jgi:type IV pilus assembly protein PilY1